MSMRYWLSLLFEPWDELVDHARMAEELGFEGVVLPDHVVVLDGERTPHPTGYPLRADEPFPEPLISFAVMAGATTRLRFLPHVIVVPLRDPFLLAKQLGTLALLSGGRVVLGTGTGWLKEEFETVGRGWSDRGRRLDEMLEVMTDFWHDGWAEHHGAHYEFDRSGMFPVPTSTVPIWVGGHSTAAATRASRFDGYMPMRGFGDATRAEFALIDRLREERSDSRPFERIVPWPGGDAATAAELEAEGIGSVLVFAWPMSGDLPASEKRAAATAFAETVMR